MKKYIVRFNLVGNRGIYLETMVFSGNDELSAVLYARYIISNALDISQERLLFYTIEEVTNG